MIFIDERDIRPLNAPREGVPEVRNDIATIARELSRGYGPFAIDTERAQGIRYSNGAYLIQIRRSGAGTFLIDPIGNEHNMAPLAQVLNQDEWILHAAGQDLPCLGDLGLFPPRLFDTEIAALLLGFSRVSLQNVTASVLGFMLAKEYAASDWGHRPLSHELRNYAALDVELLIELREELRAMLRSSGRLAWCEQECEKVRLNPPHVESKHTWTHIARREKIEDRLALAMLKALEEKRDALARERDITPTAVLRDERLVMLAKRKPKSLSDVRRSRALSGTGLKADAQEWWEAIQPVWKMKKKDFPNPTDIKQRGSHSPRTPRPGTRERDAYETMQTLVMIHADELGIREQFVMPAAVLKLVVHHGWNIPEEIPSLLKAYGALPWQINEMGKIFVSYFHHNNFSLPKKKKEQSKNQ